MCAAVYTFPAVKLNLQQYTATVRCTDGPAKMIVIICDCLFDELNQVCLVAGTKVMKWMHVYLDLRGQVRQHRAREQQCVPA